MQVRLSLVLSTWEYTAALQVCKFALESCLVALPCQGAWQRYNLTHETIWFWFKKQKTKKTPSSDSVQWITMMYRSVHSTKVRKKLRRNQKRQGNLEIYGIWPFADMLRATAVLVLKGWDCHLMSAEATRLHPGQCWGRGVAPFRNKDNERQGLTGVP